MRKKNLKKITTKLNANYWRTIMTLVAIIIAVPTFSQTIRYVKPTAEGDGSGSSWDNASSSIQAMIDTEGTNQVWVAEGTYYSENNGLIMKNNVAVYGGFPATGTPVIDDRDWEANPTILSGNSTTRVIYNNFTEGSELDDTAVLDGFTLSGGGNIPEGGGMYNMYASPTVNNVIIIDNTVFTNGPGVYNMNSSPSFTNVIITNNTGVFGGGMYNSNSSPTLTNVEISNNSTQAFGAGMYNNAGSVITINDVVISNNDSQAPGGGVYIESSTFTATEISITDNTTTALGGALYITGTAVVELNDAAINNNESDSPGGGIYSDASSLTINGGTVNNNTSNMANGGGIYVTGGSLELTDVTIDGNSASAPGGGVYTYNSEAEFMNVNLVNNTSTAPGGGLYNDTTNLTYVGGTVNNNESAVGGGIYNNSSATFTNLVISGNTSSSPGGGVYNSDAATTFTNVVITGNITTNPVGGGIYNTNAPVVFTNVTIAGNSSTTIGGGIYNSGDDITIRNSIIYGNSSGVESDTDVTYEYSLVQGVMGTDDGNITGDTDPLFVDAPVFNTAPFTGGDYTLQSTSLALNAGSTIYYDAGETPDLSDITTDVAGGERIQSFGIEMGAYEVQCNTSLPEGDENQFICTDGTISDLEITGTDLIWYDAETEGNALVDTTVLVDGATYYVSQTIDACESLRKPVTVTIVTIDASAQLTGNTIAVTQEGASYQWIDCDTGNDIEGATEQSYTATVVGEYAVIVSLNGCETTSECITVNEILSSNTNEIQNGLVVYPNPAETILNINTNANITAITVFDVLGKTVMSGSSDNTAINISGLQPGVYVISLTAGENVYTRKFIKK